MQTFGHFRYFILLVITLANISYPLSIRNMIYGIQPMINHTALEIKFDGLGNESLASKASRARSSADTCHPQVGDDQKRHAYLKDGPYLFGDSRQALILSVLAVGQLAGTLFSLLIFDFVYMGPILSISLVWSGLLNIFLPVIADKGGSVGVVISRFSLGLYYGLLTPINNAVVNNWYRTSERDMVTTVIGSAGNIGNTLFAFSGYINGYLGWEALFYIPGAMSIGASLLIATFLTDDPLANKYLSDKEKKLLADKAATRDDYVVTAEGKASTTSFKPRSSFHTFNVAIARMTRRKPAPWFRALGYLQFWALLSGAFGHHWACEATVTYTQIYLTEIHNYSLSKASMLNTVPTNVSMVAFGFAITRLARFCLDRGYCTKHTVRRLGGILLGTTGFYFLLLGLLPCWLIDQTIVPLLIFSSFRSGTFISLLPAFHDISPTYQDTLFSLSMVVGFIPGFVVPAVMGVVGKETRREWLIIFLISAAVIFSSVGFFILSIRPEIQDFDEVALRRERSKTERKKEDFETEFQDLEPPPKSPETHSTPQAALDYASRAWPDEVANVKGSLWEKVTQEDMTKIFLYLSEEFIQGGKQDEKLFVPTSSIGESAGTL